MVFDRLRTAPERSVAFPLAVAGFEEYARRIGAMFADRPETLLDLVEGLFHIAMADGFYHPGENAFLERVAEIFGLPKDDFAKLRMRFVPDAPRDPYVVLGVRRDMSLADIRGQWRKLARENHPDALIARGLPPEAIQLAEKRMADINRAWEEIEAGRA